MEAALLDILYELPSIPDLRRVIVTAEAIRGGGKPVLEFTQARKKSA
jgi:ATP-dependent protease Clp ATPase subunit